MVLGTLVSAQQQWQNNRFSESENMDISSAQNGQGPGQNDDDYCLECDDVTVPIDGYTAILFLIAVGIIIFTPRRRITSLLC